MKVNTMQEAIKAMVAISRPYLNCADSIIEGKAFTAGASVAPDLIKLANLALAVQDFLRQNRHITTGVFTMDMIVGQAEVEGINMWQEYIDLPGWPEFLEVYNEYFG
jgi:hypothetical protein